MGQYRAGLCHHPVWGNTLRGFLSLYSTSLDFQMRWGQWYKAINVNISYNNIAKIIPCSYLLIFPAFEVCLKDGKKYKFVSPNRTVIVKELKNKVCGCYCTDRIKKHFEEEANEYDVIIQKLIPYYNQMINAMISVIPFSSEKTFSVIDLGCGTGTISHSVKSIYPNVNITCVDIAEKMLEIAKDKIGGDIICIQADFNKFEFLNKYDLIISSLALHHLENDSDKLAFYKKIFSALNQDGVFINIDVVLGSDNDIQDVYMKKWKEFMSNSVSDEEINNKWIPNYYAEDRPTKLITHLDMLKEIGFSGVDVVYKYFNYAVYIGKK